jgi:ankyrin repeat protein
MWTGPKVLEFHDRRVRLTLVDSPYEILAWLIADAPGRAAPTSAVEILRQLALAGDEHAATTLARSLADQLGLGALPTASSLADLTADPAVPNLIRAYLFGFEPRLLVTDPRKWADVGDGIFSAPLGGFRRLVAMEAALETEALRAYLLWAAVGFFAAPFRDTGARFRLDLVDQIVNEAAVVPGDAGDSELQFGRDFILSMGSAAHFAFVINHEFGHIDLDATWAGRGPSGWQADWAGTVDALVAVVPRLWAAARASPGVLLAATDPRRWRSEAGLSVVVSEEVRPLGSYVHLSLTDGAGSIELGAACRLALEIVGALGVDPLSVAAALSRRGVFHLGLSATGGFSPALGGSPETWWQRLTEMGRTGANGDDLQYVLGVATRPAVLFAVDASVEQDLAADDQFRDAVSPPSEVEARLGAAVRCGDAEWAATLVAVASAAGAVSQLGGLGISCAVVKGAGGIVYRGANVVGLLQVLEVLERAGFDLWSPVPGWGGQTVLTDAAGRSGPTTGALLALGAPPGQANSRGQCALHTAVQFGTSETISVLLAAGTPVDQADGEGLTPLHLAAGRGDTETIGVLLAAGANVDASSRAGLTPLMGAANAAAVEALYAAGADPGAVTTSGETALMAAAGRGAAAAVMALISAGADVNVSSDTGLTALHQAAQSPAGGRLDTVGALLAADAEADEETDHGLTALMGAARVADPQLISLLLEHGADPNAATVNGQTALMFACEAGGRSAREFDRSDRAAACVGVLIAAGAAVDARNVSGETALLWAAWFADAILVRALLEAGADPNARSDNGSTALGYARRSGLPGLVDVLVVAGASEPA